MGKTSIEWATDSANHQAGCTKTSEGCVNCYAETMSARIKSMGGPLRYETVTTDRRFNGTTFPDLVELTRIFDGIANARQHRRTFIGSMTDLWHESQPVGGPALGALAEELEDLWSRAPDQIVMMLTKRAERQLEWAQLYWPDGDMPGNVWLGVTVENQARANERIPHLLAIPAAVRFVSCEPLLGMVNLATIVDAGWHMNALTGGAMHAYEDVGGTCGKLHWVIAGGESGPNARPTHPEWFRSLRDQCSEAGVPYHFKQWGEWIPNDQEHEYARPSRHHVLDAGAGLNALWVGKKAAGRKLDGRTWDGLPEVAT